VPGIRLLTQVNKGAVAETSEAAWGCLDPNSAGCQLASTRAYMKHVGSEAHACVDENFAVD